MRVQVLGRGERLELLVEKTDSLGSQAFAFKRQVGVPLYRMPTACAACWNSLDCSPRRCGPGTARRTKDYSGCGVFSRGSSSGGHIVGWRTALGSTGEGLAQILGCMQHWAHVGCRVYDWDDPQLVGWLRSMLGLPLSWLHSAQVGL